MTRRTRSWPFVALATAGCFDVPAKPAPEPDRQELIDAAVNAYAVKYCATHEVCEPPSFEDFYQDQASCVGRLSIQLRRSRFPEGSNTTPEDVEACTAAIDFSTCAQFFRLRNERVFPDGCFTPGQFEDGVPCLHNRQCESTFCKLTAPEFYCGVCAQRLESGAPCDQNDACGPGVLCLQGTCVPYVDEGEPCGPDVGYCHTEHACLDGRCAPTLAEGAACAPVVGGGPCEFAPRQAPCAIPPGDSSGSCTLLRTHLLDEPCGLLPDGAFANCEHGTKCKGTAETGFTSGICRPPVEDGGVCDTTWLFGGACIAPASCFQGICRIPDAALCSQPPVPP